MSQFGEYVSIMIFLLELVGGAQLKWNLGPDARARVHPSIERNYNNDNMKIPTTIGTRL